MREIVFDTETTGFNHAGDDRLIEIGCVELFNRVETGRTFHAYFCPDRPMPPGAFAVHGLSDAFLADKPRFHAGVDALLAFLDDSPLVAHNASFDFGFLNAELARCTRDPLCLSRMIDTIALAKVRHPGAKLSLDALCTRYGIDRSHRVLHGALLDAQLLAQVYVELTGGRQIGLGLAQHAPVTVELATTGQMVRPVHASRHFAPSIEERARHAAFVAGLREPLWGTPVAG